MRIRMQTSIAGPGLSLQPGDEHDFPTDEAIRLCKSGAAVPVEAIPIERAVVAQATERRSRRRMQDAV